MNPDARATFFAQSVAQAILPVPQAAAQLDRKSWARIITSFLF